VRNVDESAKLFSEVLGLELIEMEEHPGLDLRIAILQAGESKIELLEPIKPESPIGKFLDKKGPGIHHLCFSTDDINAKLSELKSKGAKLIDEKPRTGACGKPIAFLHPTSFGGVLVELVEERPEPGGE
jgi:methylmalonyl-CoA/ethylmalonyl-CoA epimerase